MPRSSEPVDRTSTDRSVPALNRINFPLYSVSALSANHVVVAGGGGSSNTGVFNGFAICEIGFENRDYVIYETQRYDTSPTAIMNCTVGSSNNGKRIFLAAGKDADCYIYQFKLSSKNKSNPNFQNPLAGGGDGHLRRRNQMNANGDISGHPPGFVNEPQSHSPEDSDFMFNIQTIQSVQTDFSSKDPFQTCVAFSGDGRLVITAGSDGSIRVWNFPEMKLKIRIEASKTEISDLDISPDRQFVSTISNGKCKIWAVSDGKLKLSLDLPPEDEGRFRSKRSRFGLVEDKRNICRLFVALNPTNHKKDKSYLQHWTGPNPFTLTKGKEVGETISALAVSKCGKYLAIGTMDSGHVDIYISFSLQRVKHVQSAHGTFVTGVSFLPPAEPNEEYVLANCDAAVVSVSVDNKVLVHHIERTSGISAWLAVLLVIAVLVATFISCSYLDL